MKKIFIFDAYSSNRELLAEELAAAGNLVVATGSRECVMDSLTNFDPDLIILDPYVRGKILWDLLTDLKGSLPRIPILIFTASLHPEDFRSRLADAWIRKSFLFEELKQNISHLVDKPGKNGDAIDAPFSPFSERKAS